MLPGLYTAHYKHTSIYLLVYVDDILIAKTQEAVDHVKTRLTMVHEPEDHAGHWHI